MKSTITQLYDYAQAQIPDSYRHWRVRDKEIAQHLETLARDRARLEDVSEVQRFDAVQCKGVSSISRWNRPNLLFFPGRGLCEGLLEDACLGKQVGETYTVAVEGGEASFTVERIVRQFIPPVNDDLVRTERIPDVDTVADYYRWFREQNEPERYENAVGNVAYTLLEEIAKNSVFSLDLEEKDAWCSEEGRRIYDIRVASGMDPAIPEDGTTFLTEEEALAKMQVEQEPRFLIHVAAAYFVETIGGQPPEQVYSQWIAKIAAETELPPNAETDDPIEYVERESGKAFLRDMAYMEAAIELLRPHAKNCVEE